MAGFFDFLNNVPQNQNNQSQPPPTPWNTRTPMPTSSPSPSGGSNWNTRIPFTPSPPPDNTQPPQQSDPAAAPPSGGFFSNLWNGVKGAANDAFDWGIQKPIQTVATGIADLAGAGQNEWDKLFTKPTLDYNGNPVQASQTPHFLSDLQHIWSNTGSGNEVVHNAFQGAFPNDYNLKLPGTHLSLGDIEENGTQMAVPGGLISKPAKFAFNGIKGLSDITGASPYIAKALDATANAPGIKSAKDLLGTMFQKGYGTSAGTMDTMNGLNNTIGADTSAIGNKFAEMAQSHGLTPEQMTELPHVLEGAAASDPKISAAAKEIQDTMQNGFMANHGQVHGTNEELRNSYMGQPIRNGSIENYFPHRYTNSPEEVAAALENAGKKGMSTSGPFNMPRTFDTLAEAQQAGLSPEMNPYVAAAQRMMETSKSINTDNAIKNLMNSGSISKEFSPNMVKMDTKPFQSHIVNVPDAANEGATKALLQHYYASPADSSFINRSIDPQGAKNAVEKGLDVAGKYSGYDLANSLWKKTALYNPLVHLHNVLYNGGWLGGAKVGDTAGSIEKQFMGKSDPWLDRAGAAGAFSQDVKKTDVLKDVRNASEEKTPIGNAWDKVKGGFGYATHGALWDTDKALRTSLFKNAVESGSSDKEAAAHANKFMVDYNNTTPFENAVMKRAFPFYNWMKGNIPLQTEQWLNNTRKQMMPYYGVDTASKALSGNDSKDGKFDTGQVLSDGSHVMIDPYMPSMDPLKILHEGVIPYAFGHTNPFFKEGSEQATNKKYSPLPMTTPTGKDYLYGTSSNQENIRPAGADQGYDMRASLAHALNQFNPYSGGAVGGNFDSKSLIDGMLGIKDKSKPEPTLAERITPILGGFTSRSNPDNAATSKALSDRQAQVDKNAFNKSQGNYVSKAEKKAAYRKIR